MDGVTATTAELNYTDGVTSNIQTQLNAKGTLSNLVEDTTPQLGGTLDSNGQDIRVYDDDKLRFGDGVDSFGTNYPDMDIYHHASSGENHIEAYNGVIHIGEARLKQEQPN